MQSDKCKFASLKLCVWRFLLEADFVFFYVKRWKKWKRVLGFVLCGGEIMFQCPCPYAPQIYAHNHKAHIKYSFGTNKFKLFRILILF